MIRGPKGTEHRRIRDIICSEEYEQYIKEHPKEKINIQQVAKAAPVLEVLSAGDGYFVEQDITSLEPTVLAELSGNETYKEIYASGKPHDVYLFTAIKIMPWAGEEINKVYNISSPTKESVAEAKKRFKKERTQAKPVFLSGAYKAGVARQYRMLKLQGAGLSYDTVKEMHSNFWGPEMFGQMLEWEEALLKEVEYNGRYVLNGMGRPFAVLKHKKKDIQNIMGQSTGHCILDLMNYHLSCIVIERKIPAKCVVPDWHDERVWWAPTLEVAEDLKQAMIDSVAIVNAQLAPDIPFTGDVEISKTFSEFKSPDEWDLT